MHTVFPFIFQFGSFSHIGPLFLIYFAPFGAFAFIALIGPNFSKEMAPFGSLYSFLLIVATRVLHSLCNSALHHMAQPAGRDPRQVPRDVPPLFAALASVLQDCDQWPIERAMAEFTHVRCYPLLNPSAYIVLDATATLFESVSPRFTLHLASSQALFAIQCTSSRALGFFYAEPQWARVYYDFIHELLDHVTSLEESVRYVIDRPPFQFQPYHPSAPPSSPVAEPTSTSSPPADRVPLAALVAAACASRASMGRSPSYSSMSSDDPDPPPTCPPPFNPPAAGVYVHPPVVDLADESSSSEDDTPDRVSGHDAPRSYRDQAPTPHPAFASQ